MRRGTKAAYELGTWLEARRVYLGVSMREIGRRLNVAAASVSQIERGQRALKEEKIPMWAEALEIKQSILYKKWIEVQERNPEPPLVRLRTKSITQKTLEERVNDLTGNERQQVLGYIDRIIEMRSQGV